MTGRYRLVESIGQGGMGRVWRAADEILDRQVAVKEMRIDGLDAEDSRTRRERTLREARATARIDHPNVVRIYDVVDEGERLWIVMELVAGRSLERILAEAGPLSPGQTARLGLGLVAALRQVHARGVLHRDIKPGNVLVEHADGVAGSARDNGNGSGPARRVVLTDFGIAAIQDAEALTMVGMLVGSPDYMAPERISGRPQGPPSDIWSLGATLCAALGGRSPFSRDTTLATLHAVLYEEPELPAAPGPLRDILTSLLAKEPSARPDLDALETALHPVAFPAPTPTVAVAAAAGVGAGLGDPEPEGVAGGGLPPGPERKLPADGELPSTRGQGAVAGGELPLSRGPVSAAGGGSPPSPERKRPADEAALPSLERTRAAEWRSPVDEAAPSSQERTPAPEWKRPVDEAAPSSLERTPAPEWRPPVDEAALPSLERTPAPGLDPTPLGEQRPAPPPRSRAPLSATSPEPESPTPAHLPAPPDPAPRDPRRPAPAPGPHHHPTPPAPPTSTTAAAAAAKAQPAAPPGEGRAVGTTHRAGPGPVSLSRAQAETERRPHPTPPPMPPGELPGPAVPAAPRTRRSRTLRRTVLTATAALATAGTVAAILLATSSGSPGGSDGTPRAGSSASAQPTSGDPTEGPAKAGTPAPTVEGTTRPRTLPPGTHREAGGFAWATPDGWRRDVKTGAEVHYTSPDGSQELVGKSSLARGDLLETWQTSERNAHQGQDYRKIRLEETTFRGHPAVVWEYTFTLRGVHWHARLLGFNVTGKSYQVNTWYEAGIEEEALAIYAKVRDSFTVL
ncbi:protein kinase [Streptomyces sp. NPDC047880]|uniref:protein kinase domain-containing protein n=1 Tax=Streptomyces sp. NPDC047880 TaxID=3155626 RepID=UPI0034525E3F